MKTLSILVASIFALVAAAAPGEAQTYQCTTIGNETTCRNITPTPIVIQRAPTFVIPPSVYNSENYLCGWGRVRNYSVWNGQGFTGRSMGCRGLQMEGCTMYVQRHFGADYYCTNPVKIVP